MKFDLEKFHQNIHSEELISDMQRVAKELKQNSVTMKQQNSLGRFHSATIAARFGSWLVALGKAGLNGTKLQKNRGISKEELFKNLEEVWIKLGRQPRWREMNAEISKYGPDPYVTTFGSWVKALEKFVAYINAEKPDEKAGADNSPSKNILAHGVFGGTVRHKTKREISDRLRFRILMRDGFACKKCGRSPIKERDVELHVDHISPWSKGGETVPENLETKCSRCNLGKGNAFNE